MRFDSNASSSRHQHRQHQHLSTTSLPKFHTAFADTENRITIKKLTFDIEKVDSSISLTAADCLCIVGERKYTNAILVRLCVRALISKRQRRFEGSTNVVFIDAGGKSSDIYLCVNLARQYGLDIKKFCGI